jgi:hypothetical protein
MRGAAKLFKAVWCTCVAITNTVVRDTYLVRAGFGRVYCVVIVTEVRSVQGVTNGSVIRWRAAAALGGAVWKGEEEHECQQAGSVKHVMAAHWKHPTILLLAETAAWYSKEERSCELSLLNEKLLLMTGRKNLVVSRALFKFHQVQKNERRSSNQRGVASYKATSITWRNQQIASNNQQRASKE